VASAVIKTTETSTAFALPQEAGRPRVQRLVSELRPVHLEREIPARSTWTLTVDGLVARPLRLSLAALQPSEREIDFHCVWGWSRPACRWEGVLGSALLERCGLLSHAAAAVFAAADSPYTSCVRLDDIAEGILAWKLAGKTIPPEHGGPLRFVPPAHLWGYKGVKWLERITFIDRFQPCFWDQKVGDPEGRVPDAILALFERDRPASRGLRTLDDVGAERRIKHRDCRNCRNYEPAEDGLQYGWCAAHKQHVKLYHPADSWYSQCLFKSLRRARPPECA
jgi:hypothetical protein